MGQYTIKLNAEKTAMVDQENPSKNFSTGSSYPWKIYRSFCMGFETIPSTYNGKRIVSAEVNLYASGINYIEGRPVEACALKAAWEESIITYQNSPRWDKLIPQKAYFQGTEGWQKLSYVSYIDASFSDINTYGIVIDDPQFNDLSATFYTRQSSYPPYLNLIVEDAVFLADEESMSPSEGFAGKHVDNTFLFTVTPPNGEFVGNVIPSPNQIVFRWKPIDGQATEVTLPGTQTQYVVPAETFTTDQIQWQITVSSDGGDTTSKWFTLTTVDSISDAKAVSPDSIVVDGSLPIEFKWNHVISTGSPQTKYEIEYSNDSGLSWKPLKSEATQNTFTTIESNTLPSGNVLWKVRTYNTDNVAGNWSDPVQIVVKGVADTPSITSISEQPRPIVKWQSNDQQAYKLEVYSGTTLVYTTGEMAGTQREHKVSEYLASGVYTVRVKIWNSYNSESQWTVGTVKIPISTLKQPDIYGSESPGTVEIQATGENFVLYYLIRDGIPIAKSVSGTFSDHAASAGDHTYIVRGISSDDNFSDSNPYKASIYLPFAMIAAADSLDVWVPLIYRRGSDPNWTENIQPMGNFVYAAGRKFPFYDRSEFWGNSLSFTYSYRTKEEYEKVKDLMFSGKVVRYRGKDGTSYWMVLTGLQTTSDYMSKDFTLSAQEVDYVERIPYEE